MRIAYATPKELAAAVEQMAHGAILVPSTVEVAFDAAIELELSLPDGTSLTSTGRVLQVLPGHGVAVTIDPAVAEQLRARSTTKPAAATPDEPTHAQKIQMALHGTRDQRNAILRDKNRQLHAFVLKNPQINVDDVLAIAKNPMMGPEMYKLISERPDWLQRPQIAVALARNPKVPGEIAIRALAHVAPDALRQLAKGGAPPHVVTAARKKVIGK